MNSTLALDYRPDGARFSTAGLDRKARGAALRGWSRSPNWRAGALRR